MGSALIVVNVLNALIAAGLNAAVAVDKVSALVKERHAAGGTITQDDLIALFKEGDVMDADLRAKIDAALADQNTPK